VKEHVLSEQICREQVLLVPGIVTKTRRLQKLTWQNTKKFFRMNISCMADYLESLYHFEQKLLVK
jgi:hypothetical protein